MEGIRIDEGDRDSTIHLLRSRFDSVTYSNNPSAYMSFADEDIELEATQNEYIKVTGFTAYRQRNSTILADSVKSDESGVNWHKIEYHMSYSGANTDDYHTAIFINNVHIDNRAHTDRGMTTTNIGVVSAFLLYPLENDDWISLRIVNHNNNNNPTIVDAGIIVTWAED